MSQFYTLNLSIYNAIFYDTSIPECKNIVGKIFSHFSTLIDSTIWCNVIKSIVHSRKDSIQVIRCQPIHLTIVRNPLPKHFHIIINCRRSILDIKIYLSSNFVSQFIARLQVIWFNIRMYLGQMLQLGFNNSLTLLSILIFFYIDIFRHSQYLCDSCKQAINRTKLCFRHIRRNGSQLNQSYQ